MTRIASFYSGSITSPNLNEQAMLSFICKPTLDLDPDSESNLDVVKICNYLVHLLRNPDHIQILENNPSAYHEALAAAQEVLVAVQDLSQSKPFPTPALTPLSAQDNPPREHSGSVDGVEVNENDLVDPGGRGSSAVHGHRNLFVDSHDQISTTAHDQYENLLADADEFETEQTNHDSQCSTSLNVCLPSDRNNDSRRQDTPQGEPLSQQTVTSSTLHRLDTIQNACFKRKQDFRDGRSSKRAHTELPDAANGDLCKRSAKYLTTWTHEEFTLRYYMLLPSSSRTLEIRDLAGSILTEVLEASNSEGLEKYQVGLTEVYFGADTLATLENLRTDCLDHHATVIQKNLRARYYRSKYLEARNAILLIQSAGRGYLARKCIQEKRSSAATTAIQRVWRGHSHRKTLDAIRNNVTLIQAAAKGFLRRRHIKSWQQYRRTVVLIQSLWRGKCARRVWEKIRQEIAPSDAVGQEDHRNDRMAKLPTDWQAQLQRIKSIEVLKDCQHFCYMIRNPVTSIDIRPDQNALKQSGGPDKISAMDRRLKQLKFILEDGWEKEKAFEAPKIVLQFSKRVHLAELVSMYEAEKAVPQKRGQPSAREKFVNIFFPHTIKDKSKKASRRKKGEKGNAKSKKVSKTKGEQLSEQEMRQQAEGAFDYWIRLGKPLWIMSQRYGAPILAVLPKEVTETSLCALLPKKGHYQDVVDCIELHHPGIKEQISNLSFLLRGMDESKLPPKRLVIETLPYHELADHPFEELFQFSNISTSPKQSDLSEEQSRPSQIPIDTVDNRQADAAVGPSSDQGQANEQISHTQGTSDAVKNVRPGYISESLRSRSLSADIEDGKPSNSITDYGEFAHLFEKPDSEEFNQQSTTDMEDPSSFQDVDPFVQPQPSHNWGDLNPKTIMIRMIGVNNNRSMITRENSRTPKTGT
ncbi:Type V myosin heavy chain MYO2 [Hyphodiscus hymeniophilus]|uniref:Type V myosin heavy chain MYO2 n=1 Tax=Hyphodiscus hymeniophilus TaxID=353542 RepID=A0A9P6SK97_9HELO|nr:Type V myosin heavy chain MYO2 [Hyphodiscus hymeniophilus]